MIQQAHSCVHIQRSESRVSKRYLHTHAHITLVPTGRMQKWHKCPLVDGRRNETWCVQRNAIQEGNSDAGCDTTTLEDIRLSGMSQ